MTDLNELLERVTSATEPDRDLDAAIEACVGEKPRKLGAGPAMRPLCPPFTFSVDAALELIERALPGWGIEVTMPAGYAYGGARLYPGDDRNRELTAFGKARTLPLAIIAALLVALIRKESSNDQ